MLFRFQSIGRHSGGEASGDVYDFEKYSSPTGGRDAKTGKEVGVTVD